MNHSPILARHCVLALAAALCALPMASQARAADHKGKLSEEFHHTYPIAADGRVALDNINGAVHITAWDRNEVKVDAIKYANTQERMDEAQVEVDAGSGYVSIRTKYRDHNLTFNDDHWNNPATVEYTLMVPRTARLDEIKLINGDLEIQGTARETRASCINGRLSAQGLAGRVKLSTVNGRLEPQFDRLGDSPIELSSVNGSIELTLPSDAKAEVEASTISGGISNDFGLHVRRHQYVGQDLHGELAGGGTRIRLSNVNGRIEVRHANDGRTVSPVKDLNHDRNDDEDEDQI